MVPQAWVDPRARGGVGSGWLAFETGLAIAEGAKKGRILHAGFWRSKAIQFTERVR